jgi:signal transduction histidine kinase
VRVSLARARPCARFAERLEGAEEASDHGAGLRAEGDEAVVDASGLEQAVGHLIQNAVEASSSDAPITVRVAPVGDEVRITIADHGTGMDGDFVRNRLFQPFASTKPGGFGIGSFEARSLIVAMGGRLVVDSTPGAGSEFSIFLPAADEAAQPQRKRA